MHAKKPEKEERIERKEANRRTQLKDRIKKKN